MEKQIRAFQKKVLTYWKQHGRHELPWRKTRDPYKILVSEVMLQQTQVPRVIEKYKEFLTVFPSVYVLAQASLRDVLKVWSGLGYNRRGKFLHDAAHIIVSEFRGSIKDATASKKLPGIGPYTRAAVRVFAFNEPHSMIETNIRAVYIHHFFQSRTSDVRLTKLCKLNLHNKDTKIDDAQILPLIQKAAIEQDPREWHWALMDYGVHIKKAHKNPSRRSASYTKQSKFEGSLRQMRGAILRTLSESAKIETDIYLLVAADKHVRTPQVEEALASLQRDGLIIKSAGKWRIA